MKGKLSTHEGEGGETVLEVQSADLAQALWSYQYAQERARWGPGLAVGKVQKHKGSAPQKGCQLTRAGPGCAPPQHSLALGNCTQFPCMKNGAFVYYV